MNDDAANQKKENAGKTIGKRSQSLSMSQKPSVMSLLPQIKVATQESVHKLTHRQLKVADILKRGHNPSGLLSPVGMRNSAGTNRRLIQDNSMVTLNTNNNISSQQLFLTGVQGANSRI